MNHAPQEYVTCAWNTRKETAMPTITDDREELFEAWRLWHQLQALSDSIWKRYEPDFIELCIAEEDRRQLIPGDDPLLF